LANASRWSLSARQGFLVVSLLTAGLFVLCCGTGMTNIPVAVLGGAVALLGPTVILLSSARANRADVFGSAHVSQSSQPPATGIYGRADLRLMINAQGVRNAVVRVRDPQVPVSKWPDVGATLPVLIPNGNPRRAQVLWDQVRSHRDNVAHGGRYSRYGDEDEDYYEYSPTPPAGVDLIDQVPDEDEVDEVEDEVPVEEVTVDPVSVDDPWRRPANMPAEASATALDVAAPDSLETQDSPETQAPVPAGVSPATHTAAASAAPATHTAPASAAPAAATPVPAGPLPRRHPQPWPSRQAEAGTPGVNGAGGANGRAAGSPPVEASASATSTADEVPERSSPESTARSGPLAQPESSTETESTEASTQEAASAEAASTQATSAEAATPDAAAPEAAASDSGATPDAAAPDAAASAEAPLAAPPAERERSTRPSVVPAQPTAAAVSAAEAAAAMVAEAEAQARAEAQAKADAQADTRPKTDTQAGTQADTRPKTDTQADTRPEADTGNPAPAEAAPEQETAAETPPEPEAAQPTPQTDETQPETQPDTPQTDAEAGPAEPPRTRPRAIELTITNPALGARTEPDRGNGHATTEPYVASYLSDEPEDSQPGLGGVHNVSVTLIVADLRRSLTFYRDLLGLTEIDSGVGSAVLASGNARILLRQVTDTRPVDRRVVHLNLEVDDVHEAYERLRREGVEFMHPPRVVSQGEQLEQWAATLRDPDGHAIALTRWEGRWETRP
jgi:catechol 2,3-dioxygenase-like lactoylglutathione lyase family enzyme